MALDPILILVMAAVGAGMGVATSLVGMRAPLEFTVWTVLYLLIGFMTELSELDEFLSFVLGSSIGGVLTGIVQTVLLERYRANNPHYADRIPARKVDFAKGSVSMGLLMGVVFGAAVGGAVWGIFLLIG